MRAWLIDPRTDLERLGRLFAGRLFAGRMMSGDEIRTARRKAAG